MSCPSSSGSHSVPPPVATLQTSTEAFNTLERRGGGEQLISFTLTVRLQEQEKKKKNQATVTPDHYPLSTAFTDHIKGRIVKMMSQRKRKSKNKRDGIYYSSLELALLG